VDNPPGNYWIVDLSPDYSELDPDGWAIVSDPTGFSGFLLSRTPVVTDQLYRELMDRASVKGVRGWITRTRQYASETAALAV
jgi:lipocalin